MHRRFQVELANEAVQIFGGYGYTKDYPAEKYYRDAKLCTIGEGTSEIQKLVISRSIEIVMLLYNGKFLYTFLAQIEKR